jgi:uncharacterized protein (DUF1800 family)
MASLSAYTDVLGTRKAAHLLRRAVFGATKKEIDAWAAKTPQQAVAVLLTSSNNIPLPPKDPATGNTWVNPKPSEANSDGDDLKQQTKVWWLTQMRTSPLNSQEKFTYFLHTHFTTIETRIEYAPAIYYQNALFRHYALGNFKELSKKICIDNAMLVFLDGRRNEVGRPNENFAREFFELYSIGKGPQRGPNDYTNYTEDDIVEASKVFSGFGTDEDYTNMDADTGLAIGKVKTNDGGLAARHDASTKTFSSAFQNTVISPSEVIDGKATEEAALDEIDQLIEMVFAQEETARHICRKLYRFFVYYEITEEIEKDIIEPLAETFRNNNYEIKPVLEQLFTSEHFYDLDNTQNDDDNIGAIIKSPLELVIGTLRFFKAELPDETSLSHYYQAYISGVLKEMQLQGLDLYEPFEVAGYAAYHQAPAFHRNWISANYLAQRYKFTENLINGFYNDDDLLLCRLDVMEYVNDPNNISDPSNPELMVRELIDYLLPQEITEERFNYFMNTVLLDNLSIVNWKSEWLLYKSTGDDSNVRGQVEKLFLAITQSPEYQLS